MVFSKKRILPRVFIWKRPLIATAPVGVLAKRNQKMLLVGTPTTAGIIDKPSLFYSRIRGYS